MPTNVMLAIGAVLVIFVLAVAWPRGSAPRPAASGGATAQLSVEGMVCGACAARVGKIAALVDGVHDAVVDRDEGRARIAFDPTRTSPESIALAISQAGFQAGVVP